MVDGDQIIAILGLHLKRKGKLNKNTIVATVMSNLGLDMMAKASGINLVRTKVGDRYVLRKCFTRLFSWWRTIGAYYLSEHNSTGDGILQDYSF